MKEWHERVKKLLDEKGMIQRDLMPALGVNTPAGVSHYLNGRRELSATQAMAIAEFLGVSVDWLLAGARMDQASKEARAAVARILSHRLQDLHVDPRELCRRFGGVSPEYLDKLLAGELDIGFNDIRTLGPMLGVETAAALVDVISERDGRAVVMGF